MESSTNKACMIARVQVYTAAQINGRPTPVKGIVKENLTFHSGTGAVVSPAGYLWISRDQLPPPTIRGSSGCSFIPLILQPPYFIPLQGLKLSRKGEGWNDTLHTQLCCLTFTFWSFFFSWFFWPSKSRVLTLRLWNFQFSIWLSHFQLSHFLLK